MVVVDRYLFLFRRVHITSSPKCTGLDSDLHVRERELKFPTTRRSNSSYTKVIFVLQSHSSLEIEDGQRLLC